MSRPRRQEKQVYFIKLWLLPGRDNDVIRFLEKIPSGQRAAAVLQAMRSGLSGQPQQPNEAEEMKNILDNLGELWS
jgi:hypothetical protein